MSQTEINKLLKTYPNSWFSCSQISTELGIGLKSITTNLKKMRQYKTVESKLEIQKKPNISRTFRVILYKYKVTL